VRGEVESEVVELIERRFMQAEPDEAVRNAPRCNWSGPRECVIVHVG
jgi:hypothetical protein